MRTRCTARYVDWIDSIDDVVTRARLQARVDRLAYGHPGQFRLLSGGICELKMDFGPGYRVYYTERQGELFLLCGGDKSSQKDDILTARMLLEHL